MPTNWMQILHRRHILQKHLLPIIVDARMKLISYDKIAIEWEMTFYSVINIYHIHPHIRPPRGDGTNEINGKLEYLEQFSSRRWYWHQFYFFIFSASSASEFLYDNFHFSGWRWQSARMRRRKSHKILQCDNIHRFIQAWNSMNWHIT